MTAVQTLALATALFAHFGLSEWRCVVGDVSPHIGLTRQSERTIFISSKDEDLGNGEASVSLLHEFCHVRYPHEMHTPRWADLYRGLAKCPDVWRIISAHDSCLAAEGHDVFLKRIEHDIRIHVPAPGPQGEILE